MNKSDYDLLVIGGGINGAGIARDAAGRGLKVLLVEKDDLASHTSSASSKMVHGGLRYLEYYEFHLVAEALRERSTLLKIAPHIVHAFDWCLPHDSHLRPAWLIRLGLFLYDHLAGRRGIKKSRAINLRNHPFGAPLQNRYARGFTYSDCWMDDSRLTILTALDAAERGARILTRTACHNLVAKDGIWHAALGNGETVTAARAVNAAGPWVRTFLDASGLTNGDTPTLHLVKGSHILVRRLYDGPQAYTLQQADGRVVFVIPYQLSYTMIGTTDIDYSGDPSQPVIDAAEIDYLCHAVNMFLNTPIGPQDVVGSWSGVRPLLNDRHTKAAAVTRDYKLVMDSSHGAPLLSVFGGKLTTHRRLAERALDGFCGGRHWTDRALLPGGDIPDLPDFLGDCRDRYSALPPGMIARYAYTYGTRMHRLLDGIREPAALGRNFGADLYEAEVRYLVRQEWARTAEDILHRRTKLYLHTGPETVWLLDEALPAMIRDLTG